MKATIRKLLLSKSILIALVLFCSIGWNSAVMAQVIDSIKVSPIMPSSDDSVYVYVFLTHQQIMNKITSISCEIINEEIKIEIFYNLCGPYHMAVPFDTIVNVGKLESGSYSIYCSTFIDTLLVYPGCYASDSIPVVFDSLTFSFFVTHINENIENSAYIIYPNPTLDYYFIKSLAGNNNFKINKIDMFNSYGSLVQTICFTECDDEIFQIDLSLYQAGIYTLMLYFENGKKQIEKIIKL